MLWAPRNHEKVKTHRKACVRLQKALSRANLNILAKRHISDAGAHISHESHTGRTSGVPETLENVTIT